MFEANLVGSRGCPYDRSFCGAAISANPDVTIHTRTPENLIDEIAMSYDGQEQASARYPASHFCAYCSTSCVS